MAGILEDIHPALKSLWNLENELRSAARNAIFLRNDEAKQHMQEVRRHYQEALAAIKKEVGPRAAQSSEELGSAGRHPDRDKLGPTGPAEMPPDSKRSYDEGHPHPGNIGDADKPHVGPTPTDDPRGKASQLEKEIDKKRAQTPPD